MPLPPPLTICVPEIELDMGPRPRCDNRCQVPPSVQCTPIFVFAHQVCDPKDLCLSRPCVHVHSHVCPMSASLSFGAMRTPTFAHTSTGPTRQTPLKVLSKPQLSQQTKMCPPDSRLPSHARASGVYCLRIPKQGFLRRGCPPPPQRKVCIRK